MKILWLRPSTGNNVSIRREHIIEHLEEWGVEVTLMNTSGIDSIPVFKEALCGDYDIIVGTVRVGLHIGFFFSKILDIPFIGSVSDTLDSQDDLSLPIYKLMCSLEWWTLKKADGAFFTHPTSYQDALEKNIEGTLVRNSVNYDQFSEPNGDIVQKTQNILFSSTINMDKKIVIYIGSLVEQGNFDKIVQSAQITPEWEFVFIGIEKGANIRELVSGIENAHFLGAYDHELMPGFLYHSSAALCLMDNEIPLKINEYGAAGLPTLGCPGKLQNVFSEDELIYVKPEPDQISEALRRIATDEEYAQKYADNLQDCASQHRWENVAEAYYESMRELTNK